MSTAATLSPAHTRVVSAWSLNMHNQVANRGRVSRKASRFAVSSRELDTILAALRYWQRLVVGDPNYDSEELMIASYHGDALDEAEIDALCERINT